MRTHFDVTVKPTIAAGKQAGGAFTAGNILFDWTAFDVPKGSSRLLNVTALIRGTDGADQSATGADLELFFAKSIDGVAPITLGDLHDPVDTPGWFNNIIGMQYLDFSANAIGSSDDLVFMHLMQMGNRGGGPDLVLTGEPDSGTNVGFDTIYVAGIAQGNYDFRTNVICDGIQATTQNVLTVKTGSALNTYAIGDVIHDQDDRLLGTVVSMDSATQMTMAANLANATVNNKETHNLNPITLKFSFEK